MGWYDCILETVFGIPEDHQHDCLSNDPFGTSPCRLLPPGTPVFCHFTLNIAEHTGICLGDKIVHLDGSGAVICSTPVEFLARLNGTNLADNIYYAANHEGHALASPEIASRAIQQIGNHPGYHLLAGNCHDFSVSCIHGQTMFQNWRLHDVERAITTAFHTRDWQWRCWGGWQNLQ